MNIIVITLLITVLNTLTTTLALVDTVLEVHNLSQHIVAAIDSITTALNLVSISN